MSSIVCLLLLHASIALPRTGSKFFPLKKSKNKLKEEISQVKLLYGTNIEDFMEQNNRILGFITETDEQVRKYLFLSNAEKIQ